MDSRQSRENSFVALQGLVARSGQRLFRVVWRGCGGLESRVRGGAECRRSGILPDGTGRQPLFRVRYGPQMPGSLSFEPEKCLTEGRTVIYQISANRSI